MESGSITTQRCPFFKPNSLTALTAAATALPLEPPTQIKAGLNKIIQSF